MLMRVEGLEHDVTYVKAEKKDTQIEHTGMHTPNNQ